MPTEEKRKYHREYQRRYRAAHPERLRESNRRWLAANPEKAREFQRKNNELRKQQRRADPRITMLKHAKKRAKVDDLPFDLTIDDIAIPARCPALLIPLIVNIGIPGPNSPTLDKVIPELGYVRGNVVVISYKANALKRDASPEELTAVASWLRTVYPQWLLTD